MNQVAWISSYIANAHSATTNNFLQNPMQVNNNILSLVELGVDHDKNIVVPLADKKRLDELTQLQQFSSQAWKGIRYKKSLKTCLASSGFVALKVNEELCHFNKQKDYLLSTENVVAGLSNVILEQRSLYQADLQT